MKIVKDEELKKYNKKIIKYDIIIFVNKGCVLYVCTSEISTSLNDRIYSVSSLRFSIYSMA